MLHYCLHLFHVSGQMEANHFQKIKSRANLMISRLHWTPHRRSSEEGFWIQLIFLTTQAMNSRVWSTRPAARHLPLARARKSQKCPCTLLHRNSSPSRKTSERRRKLIRLSHRLLCRTYKAQNTTSANQSTRYPRHQNRLQTSLLPP